MNDLRVRVFTHIQRLSLDYFTDEKAGVIMTRMTSDIEVLQQLLQDGLAQFAIQGLTMVVVTAVLFSYNWLLALITIAIVMPALIVASLWFRSASERAYLKVRDTLAGVISDIAESLSGVRIVASYNRQRNNVVHHRNVLGALPGRELQDRRVTANYSTASDFIGLDGPAVAAAHRRDDGAALWHHVPEGLVENANPELTIGELTAFILYLGSFFQPIQQLVQLYNTYQQGQAAVTKLRTLLDDRAERLREGGRVRAPADRRRDRASRTSSSATTRRTRCCATSTSRSRAGESVAFVGPTGSGQVDDREARHPLLRPDQRAGDHRRPRPARRARSTRSVASSASCPRSRSSSPARSATTSPSPAQTRPTRRSTRRSTPSASAI